MSIGTSKAFQSCRDEVRATAEQRWKAEASLRSEFGSDFDRYLSYLVADAAGQVRVLQGKTES